MLMHANGATAPVGDGPTVRLSSNRQQPVTIPSYRRVVIAAAIVGAAWLLWLAYGTAAAYSSDIHPIPAPLGGMVQALLGISFMQAGVWLVGTWLARLSAFQAIRANAEAAQARHSLGGNAGRLGILERDVGSMQPVLNAVAARVDKLWAIIARGEPEKANRREAAHGPRARRRNRSRNARQAAGSSTKPANSPPSAGHAEMTDAELRAYMAGYYDRDRTEEEGGGGPGTSNT